MTQGFLGAAQQQRLLALVAGQRRRLAERRGRLGMATGPGEQVTAHAREQVRAGERALGEAVEHGEAGGRVGRPPVGRRRG